MRIEPRNTALPQVLTIGNDRFPIVWNVDFKQAVLDLRGEGRDQRGKSHTKAVFMADFSTDQIVSTGEGGEVCLP